MATVMEEETLTEYKILNKGASLYTNTSIWVHRKEFVKKGIVAIDDEHIGFNSEKDEPVSIPLETENNTDIQYFDNELRHIPSRHGVFKKKTPKLLIACIAITVFIILSSFIINRTIGVTKNSQITQIEVVAEVNYLPTAISTLAAISGKTVEGGGTILRWQYNEDASPLITIQFYGMETLSAYTVFKNMNHLALQDIEDVKYADGEPYFTTIVNFGEPGYTVPLSMAFPAQPSALNIITDLTDVFKRQEISIVSETLPTANNGNIFYTITYTAEDWNLIRSLEIIEYMCNTHGLRIKNLDIAINGDKNIFTVVCTLSYSDNNSIASTLGDEKYLIPIAFGYLNGIPLSIEDDGTLASLSTEPPVIGSIKDIRGKTIYYRDTDGKIKTRDTE
jgi:hypothetical protein